MDEIHKSVLRFENKLKSSVDNWDNGVAQSLKSNIQRLIDEIEMQKNPRTLEERLKSLRQQIQNLSGDGIMDYAHQDELIDEVDNLIQAIRKVEG